jgi:hypothetical protein
MTCAAPPAKGGREVWRLHDLSGIVKLGYESEMTD